MSCCFPRSFVCMSIKKENWQCNKKKLQFYLKKGVNFMKFFLWVIQCVSIKLFQSYFINFEKNYIITGIQKGYFYIFKHKSHQIAAIIFCICKLDKDFIVKLNVLIYVMISYYFLSEIKWVESMHFKCMQYMYLKYIYF